MPQSYLFDVRSRWDRSRTAILVGLLCYFGCCAILAGQRLAAQSVEFDDGKSLPLANASGFLRIEELVRDKNWMPAAKQAASIIEDFEDQVFYLSQDHGCRTFVDALTRTQAMICRWSEAAPEALEAYRDLVDAEAEALFERANQEQDLAGLRSISRKYFASLIGDQATDQLARIEFEAGNFMVAASLWDSLIRTGDFPGRSLLTYPDSDLSQKDLMIHSLEASALAMDVAAVSAKLAALKKEFPQAGFDFLTKKNLDFERLDVELGRELASLLANKPNGKPAWIDVGGESVWEFGIDPRPKPKMPYQGITPSIRGLNDSSLPTIPNSDGQSLFWCDSHQIYSRSKFSQSKELAATKKIWSTPFRRETLPTERKRIGRPVFEVELDDGKLFARMGDPRISFRNDEITRNRSYLIGLDVANGGVILPGFPIENADPRVEFDSTPMHSDGYLFVSRRKSFRDNATNQITIQCLELSPSNRVKDLTVVWEKTLITAESNSRGLWDEVNRSRMHLVDNRLVYCGLGFVISFDQRSGSIHWITDYYRDRFEFSGRSNGENRQLGPVVRTSDQICAWNGYLFLAPTDTNDLLCIDASTGICEWKSRFPNVVHLLGINNGNLIASGHHLNWIDCRTGSLQARFPSTIPESQVGFGLEKNRGIGRGVVQQGVVYWPTQDKIFVLGTQANQNQKPRLYRIIDLKTRKTTGGNLCIENGIMLIANEREIKAYQE